MRPATVALARAELLEPRLIAGARAVGAHRAALIGRAARVPTLALLGGATVAGALVGRVVGFRRLAAFVPTALAFARSAPVREWCAAWDARDGS